MKTESTYQVTNVEETDLPRLVDIAKAAFLEDDQYKPLGAEVEGPPGHDSVETHRKWLNTTTYLKLMIQGDIAAGCSYEIKDNVGEIAALFTDPDFMNQGIGSYLLNYIFWREAHVNKWWLQTPDYAYRNHRFYTKNNFKKIKQTSIDPEIGFGFYIFERIMKSPIQKPV